jgi:hypothetical protein
MAIQFLSGLQQSYVQLIEDVGTALIIMLRDFAAVPRVAAIVGKSNRSFMREFKGDDLSNVNRVIVDVGNPLARTTAGRVQMAEQMLQMGAIKDPQQYFTVINTGKLEVMNEGVQAQLLLIKDENEKMLGGEAVMAVVTDDHKNHIIEHAAITADTDMRKDPELLRIVNDHIQEHIELLRNTSPDLLAILGQQSLQPAGAPPSMPPQGGPQATPPEGQVGQQIGNQEITGPGLPEGVNLPNTPTPPPPFENLPTNPADMVGSQ